ncbi:MAG: hypothetical protein V2A58_09205 [Planctomycetota bacterium]
MSNVCIFDFPGVLLQTPPAGGTASAPAYDPAVVGRLLQSMLIVVLFLLFAMVAAIILLRSRYQGTIRLRRAKRPKQTELEDLWFENPIERRGEKPEDRPKKDEEGRAES